jgi:hypothetical protein
MKSYYAAEKKLLESSLSTTKSLANTKRGLLFKNTSQQTYPISPASILNLSELAVIYSPTFYVSMRVNKISLHPCVLSKE